MLKPDFNIRSLIHWIRFWPSGTNVWDAEFGIGFGVHVYTGNTNGLRDLAIEVTFLFLHFSLSFEWGELAELPDYFSQSGLISSSAAGLIEDLIRESDAQQSEVWDAE